MQLKLTIVNLRNRERFSWNWGRVGIEALEPIAHTGLGYTIVPDDVQHCCFRVLVHYQRQSNLETRGRGDIRRRQVCQLRRILFIFAFVQGCFPARPMSCILFNESTCSSSVVHHVFFPPWGRLGKKRQPATASGSVIIPSIMKSQRPIFIC